MGPRIPGTCSDACTRSLTLSQVCSELPEVIHGDESPTKNTVVATTPSSDAPLAANNNAAISCDCADVGPDSVKETRKSAMAGDPEAQFTMGRLFDGGCFEIQDFVQAHAWFNLAAASGVEAAKRCRDEVEQQLGPDQIHEAQAHARQLQEAIRKVSASHQN